ncbi:MAG: xylan 1,4-beta-xylosidase [Ruminococcus sp.]|nr:xylan 1,4-beta-xylosidase [Ruminococcus sp.]
MKNINRFYEVGHQRIGGIQGVFAIIVDLMTGVNYIYASWDSAGGLTPLLDEDGEIIVSSGFELERYRKELGFNKSSGHSFNPVR